MSKLPERLKCECTDGNSSITQMIAYVLVKFCIKLSFGLAHIVEKSQ